MNFVSTNECLDDELRRSKIKEILVNFESAPNIKLPTNICFYMLKALTDTPRDF